MTDATPPANAEMITYWNDVGGPKWVRYQERLDQQLEPIGQHVMDAAAVKAGESVLDVGCGCGSTTISLAKRAGPSGRATGIDISATMLEVARQNARARGVTNAAFEQADAQVHSFRREHDVLYSRFGVMFFDDPMRAFTNLHSAMKRGGRLAFVCWQALHKNPWMSVPMMAAFQYVTIEPPASPDAPGPFAFADATRVAGILDMAGFREVAICGLDIDLAVAGGADLDETVEFMLDMGPLGRVLNKATPDIRAAVARDVRLSIVNYDGDNGVVMPGAVWIVTANA